MGPAGFLHYAERRGRAGKFTTICHPSTPWCHQARNVAEAGAACAKLLRMIGSALAVAGLQQQRKPQTWMILVRVLVVLGFALAVGCTPADRRAPVGAAGSSASPSATPASPLANGRAIFQTGVDLQGTSIVAQSPPLMPSCAACHRANGSGGVKFPGGAVSADLRPGSIIAAQKHPYTLQLLERAISTGVDNAGQPLNRVMPHWKMSPRDLNDVASYVLTGLK
jgi:mono/diheme cytochrome c family protein